MKNFVIAMLSLGTAAGASAQWTVVELQPTGIVEASEAFGVGNGFQAGYTRIGSGRDWHAILWNGTAASWVDLNPSFSLISQALGAGGGQQVGYVMGALDHIRRASLWSGSASSWVDLTPPGVTESIAHATDGIQQVGSVKSVRRASLWSGSAASWVDLHPVLAPSHPMYGYVTISVAYGVGDGQQAGVVVAASGAGEPQIERASVWSGSSASWVSLHPAGAASSIAYDAGGGQQVGYAVLGDGRKRASLWRGSDSTWLDLSPTVAGAHDSVALAVSGGQQVGWTMVGNGRASLWSGTAASWVDLHAFLPAKFTSSYATSIDHNANGTYIVGSAYNTLTARIEAVMWTLQPVDSDNDGLSNEDEAIYGTNPNDPDTDDDGLLDGTEFDMAQGTGCPNPLISDSDYDGLWDGAEVALGTSPCNPDTDGDGVYDGQDPTPLEPGVPGSYVEGALRDMSSAALDLSLALFDAPNNNARAGRRNAISSKLTSAANMASIGDNLAAIDELTSLLQKLDGSASPPDWMVDGPEKDVLYDDIQLMIALLDT